MLAKRNYIIQPYYVGNKEKKSLAIVIPAQIVKEYDFNPLSTVFHLKVNEQTNELYLKKIDTYETEHNETTIDTNKFLIPADKVSRLPASRYH